MSYKGDAFVVVGVAVILISMLLGYGLYTNAQRNSALGSQLQGSGSNISASVSSLSTGLNNTVSTSAYYIIEVLVLFLFANIGYKIALIGIKISKDESVPGRQQRTQKQQG